MRVLFLMFSLFLGIIFFSCGKEEKSKKGKVNLNFKSGATSLRLDGLKLGGNGVFEDLPVSTAITSNGVYSAKFYFREIKLCTSLSFPSGGTGYTVDGTCAVVYSNASDEYTGTQEPTAAHRATFAAAGEGKYFDILSATDRAKLNRAAEVEEGEYNYGIIEVHPWIKLTAKSGSICTKSAGAGETTSVGGDGIKSFKSQVTSLDCGTSGAEEVLMYITNANSTFKFAKPFSLKKDEEFTVDLAFNLDSEVRSINSSVMGSASGNLQSATGNNAFYFPMLRMGAAPRKGSETTKSETYFFGSASNKENLRVILYYNSEDTTKSILGINTTVLATASSTDTKANKSVYGNVVTQSGDTVTVQTWNGLTLLTFTRGVAGTATVTCSAATGTSMSLEECSGKSSYNLTYAAPTISNL